MQKEKALKLVYPKKLKLTAVVRASPASISTLERIELINSKKVLIKLNLVGHPWRVYKNSSHPSSYKAYDNATTD